MVNKKPPCGKLKKSAGGKFKKNHLVANFKKNHLVENLKKSPGCASQADFLLHAASPSSDATGKQV